MIWKINKQGTLLKLPPIEPTPKGISYLLYIFTVASSTKCFYGDLGDLCSYKLQRSKVSILINLSIILYFLFIYKMYKSREKCLKQSTKCQSPKSNQGFMQDNMLPLASRTLFWWTRACQCIHYTKHVYTPVSSFVISCYENSFIQHRQDISHSFSILHYKLTFYNMHDLLQQFHGYLSVVRVRG